MSSVVPVLPTGEVKDQISAVLRRFRRDHAAAEPVVFGSHRKPEAVVIPYELYEELLPVLEDLEIARIVRERSTVGESVPLSEVAAQFDVDLGSDI